MQKYSKTEIFETVPVPRALAVLSVPTVISQLINLIYNMVDAFFIGRTGNSYMMAATTLTLTLTMLNVAFSNLFGIGGGSLVARLMGMKKSDEARSVSAFSCYACLLLALVWSLMIGIFLHPVLYFLGASEATIGYAGDYTRLVIVLGSVPSILSLTLGHILRNAGYASQASFGLSSGGILNILLDPLFMFVLLPPGQEVRGAALATLLSNIFSCLYLLYACRKASLTAPLSLRWRDAVRTDAYNRKQIFVVGIPSAILTGLFDLANICVNILASAHSDLVLAAMGIVMKVERVPNAINVGICQGMLPIVAYNYSAGNHGRMQETIRTARLAGLSIAGLSIVMLEIFAGPAARLFLSVSSADAEAALMTIGFATVFLRIRALASPFQFTNYHTSYCMQAIGDGKATMLHACVRELAVYIPGMFLLDRLFGETGLAAALPVSEAISAMIALALLRHVIDRARSHRGRFSV